jgi:hypothetical protein
VLRRLGRRMYSRRRGRTGGPPRVRRRGGAVRGASGKGEHQEVWGLGRRTTSGKGALGRRAGHGRRGPAGARDVAAWARPARNHFADHFFEKEKLQFFE